MEPLRLVSADDDPHSGGRPYVRLFEDVNESKDFTLADKIVLATLSYFDRGSGTDATDQQIGKKCALSRQWVSRSIGKLVDAGLILRSGETRSRTLRIAFDFKSARASPLVNDRRLSCQRSATNGPEPLVNDRRHPSQGSLTHVSTIGDTLVNDRRHSSEKQREKQSQTAGSVGPAVGRAAEPTPQSGEKTPPVPPGPPGSGGGGGRGPSAPSVDHLCSPELLDFFRKVEMGGDRHYAVFARSAIRNHAEAEEWVRSGRALRPAEGAPVRPEEVAFMLRGINAEGGKTPARGCLLASPPGPAGTTVPDGAILTGE